MRYFLILGAFLAGWLVSGCERPEPEHWPDPNPWQVVVDGNHVTLYTGDYMVYGPEQEPPMIPLRLNGEPFDVVGPKTYLPPGKIIDVPQHKYERAEFDVPGPGEYKLTGQRCKGMSCERFTESFMVGEHDGAVLE